MKCSEPTGRMEASCRSHVARRARVFVCLAIAIASTPFTYGCGSHTGSVGANFAKDNRTGRVRVVEVPPGMAAAWAGLRPGDEVVAIDGTPARDLSPQQIDQKLVGKIGSKVVLLVVRDGVTRAIEVQRGPFAARGDGESL